MKKQHIIEESKMENKISLEDAMGYEPIIHTFVTDKLPDDHPLAFEEVFCMKCGGMVHCFNNECMTMWVEFNECHVIDYDKNWKENGVNKYNYCFSCFSIVVLDNNFYYGIINVTGESNEK